MSLPRVCLLKQALTALPEIFKKLPCCCQKQQSELLLKNAVFGIEWDWVSSHTEDIYSNQTYNLYFNSEYSMSATVRDAAYFCHNEDFEVSLSSVTEDVYFQGINNWNWMQFDLENNKLLFKGNLIESASSENFRTIYIEGWVYVHFEQVNDNPNYNYIITYPSNFTSEDVIGQITVYKQAPEL